MSLEQKLKEMINGKTKQITFRKNSWSKFDYIIQGIWTSKEQEYLVKSEIRSIRDNLEISNSISKIEEDIKNNSIILKIVEK